jgi:fatty-acyl-CoA synthase
MGLFSNVAREAVYISSVVRSLASMRHVRPDSRITIVDIIQRHAAKRPDSIAILCGDEVITYAQLNGRADRIAHWAHAQNIRPGDAVALLMENRTEYIVAWLGLLKVGATVALINSNLRGSPLAHSIAIVQARHLVLGHELAATWADVGREIDAPPTAWVEGGDAHGFESLDAALANTPATPADPAWRESVTCKDRAFYIFTSGTTGLPKAANISHMRMLFMMYGFAGALAAKRSDRMYNVLPLYHSAGGVCALGVAFIPGGSVVIRRKFSVNEFWDDCARYRPTFFQYIGELCRYLLNAPPNPRERRHNLRKIIGNGLRPEIWPAFQTRFRIPKIIEFYGATEGNVSMLSYDGKVGAVGRIPPYMRNIIKTRIVRFDLEREMPVRGADGFCVECDDGEVGEAIGKIEQEPGRNFEGYSKQSDTEKKILHNVFEKDDSWFRTGDLMKHDAEGYYYFIDRIGDTFRWKGENVATSEVAEALGVIDGILEANVYGVTVPGQDGRAGMAALVVTPDFDATYLAEKLRENLAPYARPVFLRLQPEMEITGTFKLRKVDLVKDGFDPRNIADPLYWLDPATNLYRRLDADAYAAIVSGSVKL